LIPLRNLSFNSAVSNHAGASSSANGSDFETKFAGGLKKLKNWIISRKKCINPGVFLPPGQGGS